MLFLMHCLLLTVEGRPDRRDPDGDGKFVIPWLELGLTYEESRCSDADTNSEDSSHIKCHRVYAVVLSESEVR